MALCLFHINTPQHLGITLFDVQSTSFFALIQMTRYAFPVSAGSSQPSMARARVPIPLPNIIR